MDYKELAEMCRYLSDTSSYTAFHDKVERESICDSCKGELCYEKVKDAHWCMYEALQRAATAITELISRAEAAEKRADAAEKKAADVRPVVRGRWEHGAGQIIATCTVCGFTRNLNENFGAAIACPNCGADMRGGNEK